MKIYLDMDDVLVNYAYSVAQHFNVPMAELYARWPRGEYQIYHGLGLPDKHVWEEIKRQPPEFWGNMPEFPWSRELFNLSRSLGETWILTSPINSWSCAGGKVQWLHKFAGEEFYQYHIGKAKWDLGRWDKILVDDKEDNITQFVRDGGVGILFPAHGNKLSRHKDDPMSVVAPILKEHAALILDRESGGKTAYSATLTH